jgi:hypothetical protein
MRIVELSDFLKILLAQYFAVNVQLAFPLSGFNPARAGRALILRSLLQYDNVHFIPRQLAAGG